MQQVGPAKEIKNQISPIYQEAAQKLVCDFSKEKLSQLLSWQYYLAFSLFPVLANRCPPHYSAFSRLGEGSGLTLPTSHYRKAQYISYLALHFNHKMGLPTLVINGETFSPSGRQALDLTMTLSGEGQNI